MAAIKIEKGVEVPRNERGSKFPLDEMEVGDSFLVPSEMSASIRNAVAYYRFRNGKGTLITKTYDDGSVRVWRTKPK